MSALSGVVQPSAAYLLTDGARFDAQHSVSHIGSKVFNLPSIRAAIGWSGYVDGLIELEAAVAAASSSQADLIGALPAIVNEFAQANDAVGLRDGVPTPPLRLLVAVWSDADNQGQLWAIHSTSELFGTGYVPFTLVRLARCTALPKPIQERVFGGIPDYADPDAFDVRRDGLALLEAERALPYDDGHYGVGGFAQLTSVTARGVNSETLRAWPDEVGWPIDPFR